MRTIVKILAVLFLLAQQDVAAEAPTQDAAKELVAAAGYGRIEVMKLLLERGVKGDGRDGDNNTPLNVFVQDSSENWLY